eukprot:83414_1
MASKNIFSQTHFCNQNQDVLDCPAMCRIKTMLNLFNDTLSDQLIQRVANHCTTSKLLNDFYHIKYDHNVDADHREFNKIFHYLTSKNNTPCSEECEYIERYYIDRVKLFDEYITFNHKLHSKISIKYQHILQLISRIHVYFIHSYDINCRLTQHNIKIIERTLNDVDALEDRKMEITAQLIDNNQKRKNNRNMTRFKEYTPKNVKDANDMIDVEAIHQILQT